MEKCSSSVLVIIMVNLQKSRNVEYLSLVMVIGIIFLQESKSLGMTRDGELVLSHLNGIVRESECGEAASTQPVMAVLEALKHIVR